MKDDAVNFPEGHIMHAIDPVMAYLPAIQAEHDVDPAREELPDGQLLHTVLGPGSVANLPPLQAWQFELPVLE